MVILLFSLLSLSSSWSEEFGQREEFCLVQDGQIQVWAGTRHLPPISFERAFLEDYLRPYAEFPVAKFAFMVLTADPSPFRPWSTMEEEIPPSPTARPKWGTYIDPDLPRATFIRLGENSFFYLQKDGAAQWVTLTGTNVLKNTLLGSELELIWSIAILRNARNCDSASHRWYFFHPELASYSDEVLLKTLETLVEYFPRQGALSVEILNHSPLNRDGQLPSALPPVVIPPAEEPESPVQAFFSRLKSGKVIRAVYRDGKPSYYQGF
ncbi:MAG TPA: hypothetical protein VLV83_24930 [Acidobacteriota bacterium]|nr:hypothetical protein [Acidobacteriota bacterium]